MGAIGSRAASSVDVRQSEADVGDVGLSSAKPAPTEELPPMNFRELVNTVGVTPRQVRYMISEGFVPPPTGGRAYAVYDGDHLDAIQRYVRLRELGFTPASIKVLLQAKKGVPFPVEDGITLVVSPELISTEKDLGVLVRKVTKRLKEVFNAR